MLPYRVFVKSALDLSGMAIANEVCTAFTIKRDLMDSVVSTFEVLSIPDNISEGDVLGCVDPYGTVVYNGVIQSISDNIQCQQMLSIFDDNWKWYDPNYNTIEGKIANIISTGFTNSPDPLMRQKFPYTVTQTSSTAGTFEQHTVTETVDGEQAERTSQRYVQNLEDFFETLYNQWGVIVDIQVPFNAVAPTITIGQATTVPVKVGNNALPITYMMPFTEIFETNRLYIYNKDGSTLRATYYGTTGGLTTNANDPLRLPVINTKYVFDDDKPVADIANEYLQAEMLNHRITFTMVLDNQLWNFFDWQLGMPFQIWYNVSYFSTVFTAYEMRKTTNGTLTTVDVTCGKVRNTLTAIFNKRS